MIESRNMREIYAEDLFEMAKSIHKAKNGYTMSKKERKKAEEQMNEQLENARKSPAEKQHDARIQGLYDSGVLIDPDKPLNINIGQPSSNQEVVDIQSTRLESILKHIREEK